jgi:hypothetical protein
MNNASHNPQAVANIIDVEIMASATCNKSPNNIDIRISS